MLMYNIHMYLSMYMSPHDMFNYKYENIQASIAYSR